MMQTYSKRRRKYPQLLKQPEYKHLEVIHLQSSDQTTTWIATLPT